MRADKPHLLATSAITMTAYSLLIYVLSSVSNVEYPPLLTKQTALLFPHVIAVINTIALFMLYMGYKAIRRGDVQSHRFYMLFSFILISAFLILYVLKIMVSGPQVYRGPEIIKQLVYLPALFIHLALSIISVPLVVYNVITGLTLGVGDVRRTIHPRIGKVAYSMWSISLVLGIFIYVMLRFLQ